MLLYLALGTAAYLLASGNGAFRAAFDLPGAARGTMMHQNPLSGSVFSGLSLSSLSGPVEILVAQTQFTGLTSTILTSMQREWDELGLEWPALALEVAVRLELTRPHACLSPA